MQLQFGLQPPAEAIRAYGARLIAREVGGDCNGIVYDRVDAQPEEPRLGTADCPPGKTAFAAWVETKAFPFLRGYVDRLGLPRDSSRFAMVDGQYAVEASTHGNSGYVYVVAYEMPAGVVPPAVATPIPPPPPGTRPHGYEPDITDYHVHKRCGVRGCYGNKGDRIHKVKVAR